MVEAPHYGKEGLGWLRNCRGTLHIVGDAPTFYFFTKFFGNIEIKLYLCTRFIKGCSQLWAEMIPSEPDTDNADAGMMSKHKTPYF